MKDSADIKWANKSLIRVLLRSGSAYTKQQIALQTGLSVASCNTYLNEMEAAGEVLGERGGDAGRVGAHDDGYALVDEFLTGGQCCVHLGDVVFVDDLNGYTVDTASCVDVLEGCCEARAVLFTELSETTGDAGYDADLDRLLGKGSWCSEQ